MVGGGRTTRDGDSWRGGPGWTRTADLGVVRTLLQIDNLWVFVPTLGIGWI